jgi:UDP-N-acetylmuramoyl-L-alanyl-D-glutamate--2,6-diaminopimelate ligase
MRFLDLIRGGGQRGLRLVHGVRAGSDPEILGVCEDSRKVRVGDLFVARGGTKANGAKFVGDAIAHGAVAVVVESDQWAMVSDAVEAADVGAAVVENGNWAAALLAHEVAGNPTRGMKMIGVTGTKGKTTVAYLMRSVLKAAGAVVGMGGTVEIDDGKDVVPAEMTTPGAVELVELFSRMKKNGVTHCVMEVSSHALHQDRVAGIEWAVGIFTNLTGDHLDYHGTMEEYGKAKRRLFEGLGEDAVAIINSDDKYAALMTENCKARVVPYCVGRTAPEGGWAVEILKMESTGMELRAVGPWWSGLPKSVIPEKLKGQERFEPKLYEGGGLIKTLLVGRHNAYNIASVVAVASELTVPDSTIKSTLTNNSGAPGRLQRVMDPDGMEKDLPFSVFVDYAHTHDALENVLTALQAIMKGKGSRENFETWQWDAKFGYNGRDEGHGRLICVFGCGGDRDRTKRPKMGAVAERLADVVVVTSDNPRTENPDVIIEEICAGFSDGWKEAGKIAVEADRRAAIRRAIGEAKRGDVVLIAGKGHENYQIVGTTKTHFDDVEEAAAAMSALGH